MENNDTQNLYPALPEKKFDIIYADPPWYYNGKLQFDKRSVATSAASLKYPTLKICDLIRLRVQDISKNDCLLFMWSPGSHLSYAIEVGRSWGFEYKAIPFIWDKMKHNPGQYTLNYCEICLLFKRGRIPKPRGARNVKQLVRSERRGHSQKPGKIRDNIVKMFPLQERIELFAREKIQGWDAWGLEVINAI